MVIDDLKLIREVKIRPYFYVKGLTGYRNSTLRKKGWEQIGGIFETTGEECCTRWRVIRDRYVKLIAKKGAKKPLTGYDKNWTLYKHLGFLKAHIKPRTYAIESISHTIFNIYATLVISSSRALLMAKRNKKLTSTSLYKTFPTKTLSMKT
uniref:MADF domain-containing protein n=1 Tax=Bactrocera latifrons TaxID=174628 RepID=A0A0K8UMK0_BACLA